MAKVSIRKRRRDRHTFKESTQQVVIEFKMGGFDVKATVVATEKFFESLNSVVMQLSTQLIERLNSDSIWYRSVKPCIYLSGSEYLKCAVNPSGDCHTCPDYLSRLAGVNGK